MPLTLSSLHRFAVKSCRGEDLATALVEPWGLFGDRRWLIVEHDGTFRTARELPTMLLLETTVRADGGLTLRAPDAPVLEVDVPVGNDLLGVRVWKSHLDAMLADDAAHDWVSAVLGHPSRLVYLDDPTRRQPNQEFARPDDRVSFADGYPLMVATTASLDELNRLIEMGPRADEGPLPMTRFRPNVVIDGGRAWDEDGWRRVRIGDAVFRAVKGCARCAIPMTDPWTAVRGKEPLTTLAKHRRWDGNTWFGMNLVPDNPGVTIAVGDDVEILESVPDPDGPPR